MALMTRERGAVVCLVMICIILTMTAGCSVIDGFTQGDTPEESCLKMFGIDRDHCYKNLAVKSRNSTFCEKIENPVPNSKCYLELGLCNKLFSQATGDGAYTRFDCYQYMAINYRSIKMCDEFLYGYESHNTNDLNPTGVSKEICIKRITENCGHIAQNACFDAYENNHYCVEGAVESGKCVPW